MRRSPELATSARLGSETGQQSITRCFLVPPDRNEPAQIAADRADRVTFRRKQPFHPRLSVRAYRPYDPRPLEPAFPVARSPPWSNLRPALEQAGPFPDSPPTQLTERVRINKREPLGRLLNEISGLCIRFFSWT